ncbi:MAG: hypothetical protein WBY44_03125 [Bryobacteraceae bacterium]
MADMLSFSEDIDTMTYPQCVAFIDRSRRQIDRYEQLAPPGPNWQREDLAKARKILDDLEQEIRLHPECPPELALP